MSASIPLAPDFDSFRLSRERRCDAHMQIGARRANHAAKAVSNEWRNACPPGALALLSIHRGSARPIGSSLTGDYTTSHAPERAGDAGIWRGADQPSRSRSRTAKVLPRMTPRPGNSATTPWCIRSSVSSTTGATTGSCTASRMARPRGSSTLSASAAPNCASKRGAGCWRHRCRLRSGTCHRRHGSEGPARRFDGRILSDIVQ